MMNSSNNENRLQRAINMSLNSAPPAKRRRLAEDDFINRKVGRSEGATNVPWGDSHYHVPDQWEYTLKHYKDQKGVSRRSTKLVPNTLPNGPEYAPHRTIRSAKQLKNYMNLARRNSRPEALSYNASFRAQSNEGRVPLAPVGSRANPVSLDSDNNRPRAANSNTNRSNSTHASNGDSLLASSHGSQSQRSGNSVFTKNSFLDTMSDDYQGLNQLLRHAPAVADPEVDRLADNAQAQLKRDRAEQIAKLRKNFEKAPTGENKFRILRLLHPLAPDVAGVLLDDPSLPAESRAQITGGSEFEGEMPRQDRRPQWVRDLVSGAGGSAQTQPPQETPPRATQSNNRNRKGKRRINE
jgi:hypothetical protein